MPLLKISAPSYSIFEAELTSILNVACVVAGAGHLPDEYDIENAETRGLHWYRNTQHGNNRFDLFGVNNDWWAFIRDEGEYYIILEFSCRNDTRGAADLLTRLLAARFYYCELIEK